MSAEAARRTVETVAREAYGRLLALLVVRSGDLSACEDALGDALVPYGQRVDRALTSILASRAWDVHQTKWLRRIAEQMKASTIVDQAALSDRPFLDVGGFPRLNKIFDGQLEAVLEDLKDRVWKEGA